MQSPKGLVGSIGVVAMKPNIRPLLEKHWRTPRDAQTWTERKLDVDCQATQRERARPISAHAGKNLLALHSKDRQRKRDET